jgi:nitrite reductase/ring-hydroxylating ferredoxin subunit
VARYVVATAAEVPIGARVIVEVAGRSIGVFNVGGEYLAVRNRCPHQGGPLCEGVQVGALHSEGPGHYAYERPNEIIRCPWHAWEFDLRTGASWFDPKRTRVRAYDVEVLPADRLGDAKPPRPGMLPGPYTAETVPVAVEGDLLVVELAD